MPDTMAVDDSEMQKLWKLTNDLTAQLVFNRSATLELKQQLADLQAKTLASQVPMFFSGFHSHHFSFGDNYHANLRLRIENERLKEENSQLQEQVQEYERWMEYIMGRFRLQNFAMAQSRKESMHEAYKMAEQGGEAAMRLQEENAILQTRLSDLGAVARKAIHEEYYTTETLIESLEVENQGLREMLGVAEGRNDAMTGPLHFHAGSNGSFADEDADDDGVRQAGNRVSFPSTGTRSYLASSGSDREQPRSETHRLPLTVQTGLRTPVSSTTSPRSASSFSLSSTASPTSPSWSPNSSTPSGLASPLHYGSDEQFKSISLPLDDVEGQADAKQKYHRGKITINTKLGSPRASRAT